MILAWAENAWDDYCYWQEQDRKTLKRINRLLQDIRRNQYTGIGKPEPLEGDLKITGAEELMRRIALSTPSKEIPHSSYNAGLIIAISD